MNLKIISTLVLFLFAFSFASFSQTEEDDSQMFGTRAINPNARDLGTIKQNVFEYKVTIPAQKEDYKIREVIIPKGFGVIITQDFVPKNIEGSFIVIVRKDLVEKNIDDKPNNFKHSLKVKMAAKTSGGSITQELNFELSGKFE